MTTVTDLVEDVLAYLVTQCRANSTLLGNGVYVVDGSTGPGEIVQTSPQRIWIGWDAKTGVAEYGTAEQAWPFLGASGNYREENGDITCTAEAWSGDPNPATARALCKAIVGAVEIMLRGAPTTGPGDSTMGGLVQWSQVKSLQWSQVQSGGGYSAMCVFHVTYYARLPA